MNFLQFQVTHLAIWYTIFRNIRFERYQVDSRYSNKNPKLSQTTELTDTCVRF